MTTIPGTDNEKLYDVFREVLDNDDTAMKLTLATEVVLRNICRDLHTELSEDVAVARAAADSAPHVDVELPGVVWEAMRAMSNVVGQQQMLYKVIVALRAIGSSIDHDDEDEA